MAIKYITRAEQIELARQRGAPYAALLKSYDERDVSLDGSLILPTVNARNWRAEGAVHDAPLLSRDVDSTRNFFGTGQNIVRDEVRRRTTAAYITRGTLKLCDPLLPAGVTEYGDAVWRSHLLLNKYDGTVLPVFVSRSASGGKGGVFIGRKRIESEAEQPDFPFGAYAQASIGHVQAVPPEYGLISYKDRKTGRLYRRRFSTESLEREIAWNVTDEVLGGASFAIAGDRIAARIDVLRGSKVVPLYARSADGGQTFDEFQSVPLLDEILRDSTALPASGPPVVDHLYDFHIPIAIRSKNEIIALNFAVDRALVEAARVTDEGPPSGAVDDVFPKKPGLEANGEGNGVTDGLGLIAVVQTGGSLFTSNSQAGGLNFPPAAHLNHEMPRVAAFASSDCYTSGDRPNIVSMDYLYLEADDATSAPVSGALYFETWDMPLPVPVMTASTTGNEIRVTIERDAHFYPGETTFLLSNPTIRIEAVQFDGDRGATISVDRNPTGATLRFEAKTLFYHHAGEAVVSKRA